MTTKADQEMRDLLVRLDENVKQGFQHINSKLDAMERKHEGHETRIRSLEDWRTEFRGGAKGIMSMGKIGWSVVGAIIGIIGVLGWQIALVPKDTPHAPKPEIHSNIG